MSSQNPFIFLSPVSNDYPTMLWRHDDVTWLTQCKSRSYTACTGIFVYLMAAMLFLLWFTLLLCMGMCVYVSPMFLDRNYLYSALLCVWFFPCVCVCLNDVLLCVRACVGVDVQVAVYKFECAYLFILVCVCMYAWNLRLLVSLITHNIYLI